MSCWRLGQTTLSSSSLVPWKKVAMLNPGAVSCAAISSVFFATVACFPPFTLQFASIFVFEMQVYISLFIRWLYLPPQNHFTRKRSSFTGKPATLIISGRMASKNFERALEDLNPRHQVLETCVLPTELRAHNFLGAVNLTPCFIKFNAIWALTQS